MRIAAGLPFLHWEGRRPAKVLYIDGEMSRRLLKKRLLAEESRLLNELNEQRREEFEPSGFHALSTEDVPNFHPLNTPLGQMAIEKIITEIGGCDFVIFDNVMSLISGSMVDEEAWARTLPWVKSLTKRSIGQLWVHHTGHDETHGYGTKTREWQMDVVIHLATAERADSDVSFKLEFKKARERRPDNRADFQEVNVALVNDQWVCDAASRASRTSVSPMAMKYFESLQNVVAGGEQPKSRRLHGCHAVHSDDWKAECELLGLLDPQGKKNSQRAKFSKYRAELVAANKIACEAEHTWIR
jgi:AAA domain